MQKCSKTKIRMCIQNEFVNALKIRRSTLFVDLHE